MIKNSRLASNIMGAIKQGDINALCGTLDLIGIDISVERVGNRYAELTLGWLDTVPDELTSAVGDIILNALREYACDFRIIRQDGCEEFILWDGIIRFDYNPNNA